MIAAVGRLCLPGVLAVQGPSYRPIARRWPETAIERFCAWFEPGDAINRFPLIVLVDDSEFTAAR